MSREWKPGDVAVVTTRSGREYRAVYALAPGIDYFWHSIDGEGGNALTDPDVSARPLVVIDPEDSEQVERLRAAMEEWADRVPYSDMAEPGDLTPLDAARGALRSLVSAPQPEEPKATGAIVRDADEELWVLRRNGLWDCLNSPAGKDVLGWADLCRKYGPLTVLSEGYSGEGS